MAKEDFCFTYYDGDAARDKAHMNRLERGGYDDLITSQRKFGRLSLALIKKTLGSDFSEIWDSIKIILKTDGDGNFFIEWVENSIQKMKRQAVKQSANGKKGGRPKAKENPIAKPNKSQTESQEKPLVNGDGYVNGYVNDSVEEKEKGRIFEIVSYLNEKTKLNFRPSSKHCKSLIPARLNEGFTLEDFRRVIDHKVSAWGADSKMKEYLRPETLFGSKFEGYLQASKIIFISDTGKIEAALDVSSRQDLEIAAKYAGK